MTKDSYSIFQNRGTLQERNQKRKKIVAHILRSEFKKEFKARRLLLGSDQFFTVDLMSDDDEIALRIIIEDNMFWNFPELIFLYDALHGLTIFTAISSSSDIKSTVQN